MWIYFVSFRAVVSCVRSEKGQITRTTKQAASSQTGKPSLAGVAPHQKYPSHLPRDVICGPATGPPTVPATVSTSVSSPSSSSPTSLSTSPSPWPSPFPPPFSLNIPFTHFLADDSLPAVFGVGALDPTIRRPAGGGTVSVSGRPCPSGSINGAIVWFGCGRVRTPDSADIQRQRLSVNAHVLLWTYEGPQSPYSAALSPEHMLSHRPSADESPAV